MDGQSRLQNRTALDFQIHNVDPPGDVMLDSTQDPEKHPEKQRPSVISDAGTLDAALGSLEIASEDADEAFSCLRDHPNADAVRQEAIDVLADPQRLKKLV